jgi:phosphate transport system permease protein
MGADVASLYFLCLAALALAGFWIGRSRALEIAGAGGAMHSRPTYHGALIATVVGLVMLAVFILGWPLTAYLAEHAALGQLPADLVADPLKLSAAMREVTSLAYADAPSSADGHVALAASRLGQVTGFGLWLTVVLGVAGGAAVVGYGRRIVAADFQARNAFERIIQIILFLCAAVAVLTTIGIVLSVLFETLRFFQKVSPIDFLFGLEWNPQTAMRADQGDFGGAFGIVPLVAGTLLITTIAIAVAGPIGLFSAIYMSEYATPRIRAVAKPILEILAGIPTVVLGFFAALTVAPFLRDLGANLGVSVASESALAAGLVMGMMIIPFVSSLSDDVMNAVPQALRDGSYAMGSTKSETIKRVVLPAALPGIVSAFMLAISRAIGETMIVVMAAGLAANLTFNPLEAVTTFTVQIKTILVGDQEFDSAKTLSAFALGFVLFFLTLMLNVIALQIVKRYRERYD